MRLYVAADLHGSAEAAKRIRGDLERYRPDVFVAAGDLTHFGRPAKYAEELFAGLAVRALAVPGNCDPPELVRVLDDLAVNLHGKKTVVGGRTFVGIGGANPTSFGTPFEIEEEVIGSLVRPHMERGAILVSHAPPRGFVDVVHSGAHVGSTAIRAIIEEFAPPVALCGHIHEARGIARHGSTMIVNPGPANAGHRAIVEIDGEVRVELL